ncbi:MAG: hypothetical protein WA695_08660 [Candidatus Dormiibacterota bacterium]
MNQQSRHDARSQAERDKPEAFLGKGAEGNARLTGSLGLVLLLLLAMEGFTILAIRPLLGAHVFLGMLLVPPVLLKIGSTLWRFARFYLGADEYQRRGPPLLFMRLLGPLVIISTVAVIGTGIGLVLGPPVWRLPLLFLHKTSFILWFGLMSLHVLGHLVDMFQFGARDWLSRGRERLSGVGARQFAVAASLVVGTMLGVLILPATKGWPLVGGQ